MERPDRVAPATVPTMSGISARPEALAENPRTASK
jgi:hypothetical protein